MLNSPWYLGIGQCIVASGPALRIHKPQIICTLFKAYNGICVWVKAKFPREVYDMEYMYYGHIKYLSLV